MHGEEIRDAARRVIDRGWYLKGKENELFEQHYAEYIDTKYCIANSLDALIWIWRAYIELGVMQPGDEVILPSKDFHSLKRMMRNVMSTAESQKSKEGKVNVALMGH